MQGRKGSQTHLEKYRYTPPTKSAIATSGRKMAAAMWAASRVLEAAGALATEYTGWDWDRDPCHLEPTFPSPLPRGTLPSTPSTWLGAGKELFALVVPDLSFSALPPWGNPWPGSCENQGRDATSLALKGGAHHPGCGHCRTHPKRLEQEGRVKGRG